MWRVTCDVRWRVAFYVAGDASSLKNFFSLLDGFFVYKADQMAQEKPFEVHLHPHVGVTLALSDLAYKHYSIKAAAKVLPLNFFDAHPVTGSKQPSTFTFEAQSDRRMSILFSQLPYHCRLRLGDCPELVEVAAENDGKGRSWLMKDIDSADAESIGRVVSICTSTLSNLAMRLVVSHGPSMMGPSASALDTFRGLHCLHSCGV